MAGPLDKVIHPRDQARIIDAIKAAERTTSGEIKVHVEGKCPGGDPFKRAVALFERLGLTRTAERNGALIYVATRDRRFSLIGDVGIHGRVGTRHWHDVRDRMVERLRGGAPREAIVAAIEAIGAELAAHYPRV